MTWLLTVLLIAVCFGAVLMVGAPYLPTLKPQVDEAIKMSGLKSGQTLIELGSGDGRVVVAAAKQGIKVVAYELNPILVLVCWLRTRRFGGRVKVVWGDFWRCDWPPADAIFTFLLPKYMSKLHKKCIQYNHKPLTLISFAFEVPDQKPKQAKNGIYIYRYLS